ncbi:MAG: hypothetical protein ACJ78G_00005, partial [Gemmatimonadaceae bacterium]
MRTPLLAFILGVAALATAAAQSPLPSTAFAPPADLTAPAPEAVKSASGLVSKVVRPGDSTEKPGPNDVVTVQYT